MYQRTEVWHYSKGAFVRNSIGKNIVSPHCRRNDGNFDGGVNLLNFLLDFCEFLINMIFAPKGLGAQAFLIRRLGPAITPKVSNAERDSS